jgi:uncharacterized membrane protein YcaP (DUF421 family)
VGAAVNAIEPVIRIAIVYLFLLALFRLAGRRTLADISPFDFVLLLIISEMVQQAVVAEDPSLINAILLCSMLIAIDIGLSLLKHRWPRLDRLLEGRAVLLLQHGELQHDTLRKMRIDQHDILAAARESQGLERLDQIRFAVLEKTGHISIVPEPDSRA